MAKLWLVSQEEREQDATESEQPAGMTPKQVAVLREHAFKPGNPGNTTGRNGWNSAQKRFRRIMMEADPDDPEGRRRFDLVALSTYLSARLPGPKGAFDRRLIVEQICGKAKQQHELTGKDGSPLNSGVMMVPVFGAGTVEDWEQASKAKPDDDGEDDK